MGAALRDAGYDVPEDIDARAAEIRANVIARAIRAGAVTRADLPTAADVEIPSLGSFGAFIAYQEAFGFLIVCEEFVRFD